MTIACADKDSVTPEATRPSPTITVYRDAVHASHVSLPIAASSEVEATAKVSLAAILMLVIIIVVLVVAFTIFMRSRMGKK